MTIDEDKGLCINVWNIGCSGTLRSNRELIRRSSSTILYDLQNPKDWYDASTLLTDGALFFSSAGAAAETIGFTLGLEAGPTGSIIGAIAGNTFHSVVTNPIETILSTLSTLSTGVGDILAGETTFETTESGLVVTLGDATTTSAALQYAGGVTPIGVADAAVDAYASAYAHGLPLAPGLPAQGIPTLFGISGRKFDLGLFSIRFGR
ncbi:MAG: hypothetical protein IT317_16340 [Anaerolineales bacterium]|nr:hypothetical protein [Anaerolineales bacterium]